MHRHFLSLVLAAGTLALPAVAQQPAEFDPSDFGKIVIQPRQAASGAGGISLEQAIGDYQNEPIVQYGENSPAVRLGRPIGRLDMLFEDGRTGFCTAFIVDESHILTNHHCIPGMQGDPSGAESGVQAAQFVAGYIKPGRPEGVDRFTVSPQIVETNRELDYTVLRVFGNPSGQYGFLELANEDPEDSEFLWIIGHPQGKSQHISREGCAAATPAISTEGKLVHTCDTLQGNSGSPVIRITDKRVVGLHHAGDSITGTNMAIPMRRILAQSQVLRAAVTADTARAAPSAEAAACDALWTEAKTLGCGGFEAYAAACGTHTFATMAQAMIKRDCTIPAVAAPVAAPTVAVGPPAIQPAIAPPAVALTAVAVPPAPEAHDGPVFSVRADGSGDFRSLGDAVAQAPAGARIEIHPGTHVGGIDVGRPLDLVGIGLPGAVVLRVAGDHVVHWTANSGLIANLSVVQDGGDYFGVFFDSGTATLEDSDITSSGLAAVGAREASNPIIRRNRIHDAAQSGLFLYDNAQGLVENNEIFGNSFSGVEIKAGANPVVRNNVVRDGKASGVYIHTGGRGRIENNDILRNAFAGVEIKDRADPVVLRNDIHDGMAAGVFVQQGGLGLIQENAIYANALSGVSVSEGGDPVVRNNTLRNGGESGIYVYDGGKGRYEDNVIAGHAFAGIAVKGGGDPVFVRNTVSDGRQSGIFVYDDGRGTFEDNEIHGNAFYGVEARSGGKPVLRNNTIRDNVWHAFRIYQSGGGTYENNDISGNTAGDFDIGADAGAFTRSGNN